MPPTTSPPCFETPACAGGGTDGGFFQGFDAEVRVEPPATSTVVLGTPAGVQSFVLGRDYYPLSIRDRLTPPLGVRDVPVVFAGYGISAPGLGYDDFAGVEVRGAAVLVFTHEPQEGDEHSRFDGRSLTPGAAISAKAREARERGARLLMVVEDPSHLEDRAMRGSWWMDPQSEAMGMPVVRLARDRLTRALPSFDPARIGELIDRTLAPQSRKLDGISVSYDELRAQFTAPLRNVLGILPGSDPALAAEAIVVGAHYDHVGTGGQFSEAPESTGQIHNGADDNASGTAALLEMARIAGAARSRFGRTIVFASFAGEELGLRGSEHYVAQPAGSARADDRHDQPRHDRSRAWPGDGGRVRPRADAVVTDRPHAAVDALVAARLRDAAATARTNRTWRPSPRTVCLRWRSSPGFIRTITGRRTTGPASTRRAAPRLPGSPSGSWKSCRVRMLRRDGEA